MFTTTEKIKELSSFDEVKALSDIKLQTYIERADSWIRRATNNPFIADSTIETLKSDLAIATWLLVEYLWYWDNPETKESVISNDENVRIGTFSYSIKPQTGSYETGIKELDDILKAYKYTPNAGNLFRISGPSRKC